MEKWYPCNPTQIAWVSLSNLQLYTNHNSWPINLQSCVLHLKNFMSYQSLLMLTCSLVQCPNCFIFYCVWAFYFLFLFLKNSLTLALIGTSSVLFLWYLYRHNVYQLTLPLPINFFRWKLVKHKHRQKFTKKLYTLPSQTLGGALKGYLHKPMHPLGGAFTHLFTKRLCWKHDDLHVEIMRHFYPTFKLKIMENKSHKETILKFTFRKMLSPTKAAVLSGNTC